METTESELFSKNIKYLRKRENLKQEELAEKLFVTPQAISKWETSKSIPDVKMLITISKLFNVSVDELLNNDLELSNTTETEQEAELSSELVIDNTEKRTRNVLVFDKSTKNYKRFIITSILFFVFFAAMIPTFFFPYDTYTLIGLFLVLLMNIIICVYQIKIMCHRKEVGRVYLSSTIENRQKAFKICMPINFVLIILLTTIFIILEDFSKPSMLFYYIYLLVSLVLLSITELLNFVYYNQVLEEAERD